MANKIIAHHAHVFQKQVRDDGTIDALKRLMDTCGIDRAVAFAPFTEYFDSCGKNPNDWLEQNIHGDPSLIGFGTIDFSQNDLAEQVRQIHDNGFKGIKLHPAFQKFKVDCEKAFTVYGAAQELDLAVSFHTGVHWHRIADYNMLLFDEVAYHFPNLRFSLEHVGGYSFFQDAVAVMINNPEHVYAGLTSVFDRGQNRFWFLSNAQIDDLLWLTGDHRSIFGLDFPYNDSAKVRQAIQNIREMGLPDSSVEKIFQENILQFLRI